MAPWLQHTLVLTLVGACLTLVSRDALRALRHQASKLAGCGSCKGCATEPAKPQPATTPKPERTIFIPSDALTARLSSRSGNK